MLKNRNLITLALSVILMFALIPIGKIGHQYKLLFGSISYFLLTWYLLRNIDSQREKLHRLFFILLPLFLLYLPFFIFYYESTKSSQPSTIAHFLGAFAGLIASIVNKRTRALTFILLLALSLWCTFVGYQLWLNKLNFNSFTSNILEPIPEFELLDNEGNKVTSSSLKNEIYVLDFWTINCGACFLKFPTVQEKYNSYKNNPKIKFYLVNIPIAGSTIKEAKDMISSYNYSIPKLYARNSDLENKFQILAYPTVIIIHNGKNLVYKGEIEGIDKVIKTLLMNNELL